MQVTQCLSRAVQYRAHCRASICGQRVRTWAQIGARVPRVAGALQDLGLSRGDRVAILALNNDRYLELLFAVGWAGGVVVPLNTRWAVPENTYAIRDCEPFALVVDEHFLGQLEALTAAFPGMRVVYIGEGEAPDGTSHYETMVKEGKAIADGCGSDDDLCGIFYTGGTTGHPKGVMLSHQNIVFAAITWIAGFGFTDETQFLHVAGFFHLAGASPAFALTMAGGTHICLPKFEPVAALETIEREHANAILLVPTMVNMLINHPRFADFDLTSIKTCIYGASSMPEAVLAQAMQKLPTWSFIQGYGMTESAAITIILPWKDHFDQPAYRSKSAGTGRVNFGSDIRIVNYEGHELPQGEVGEIAMRGAQIMLGYWRNDKATRAALRDGWLFTGDAAYMDEDGFVFIVDRVKDMIITGGENVYSREVENAIHENPLVLQCAVIGIPDAQWGESVHAVVVLRPGASSTAAAIIEHCHTRIAGYKCPRSVEFRSELPISAAGKLQKNVLRDPFWSDFKKSVN